MPGSPPRVRGEEVWIREAMRKSRITPACAGRSCHLAPERAVRKDHPRVCGEKPLFRRIPSPKKGSPPRVRGEVYAQCRTYQHKRITPACAGRSAQDWIFNAARKDHPRVCGEKLRTRFLRSRRRGSPPRVRGEVRSRRSQRSRKGITPACAGRSSELCPVATGKRDHPRVCGEKRDMI